MDWELLIVVVACLLAAGDLAAWQRIAWWEGRPVANTEPHIPTPGTHMFVDVWCCLLQVDWPPGSALRGGRGQLLANHGGPCAAHS
jgi:hypothetical protein